MNDEKVLVLTEAARARLQALYDKVHLDLERELRDRNFVPGDSTVEVTASDVDVLAKSMRIVFPRREFSRSLAMRYVSRAYMILGVGSAIVGVFFPYFRQLATEPIQLSLILTGIVIAFVGYLAGTITRTRNLVAEKTIRMRLSDRIHDLEAMEDADRRLQELKMQALVDQLGVKEVTHPH